MMRGLVEIKRKRTLLRPSVGRLLVAEPSAVDSSFYRSVVLIVENGELGSMGLVLNKPLNLKLEEVLSINDVDGLELFAGGPVDKDRLFWLHNIPFVSGSEDLGDGLFVGGTLRTVLKAVRDESTDYKVAFYSGYSGWSKGQLDQELESEAWVVVNRDFCLFDEELDEPLWRDVLMSLEDDYYKVWACSPKFPSRN